MKTRGNFFTKKTLLSDWPSASVPPNIGIMNDQERELITIVIVKTRTF